MCSRKVVIYKYLKAARLRSNARAPLHCKGGSFAAGYSVARVVKYTHTKKNKLTQTTKIMSGDIKPTRTARFVHDFTVLDVPLFAGRYKLLVFFLPRDAMRKRGLYQWLEWSCEAGGGGSPDEARLEQTSYPFHTKLIWRYLGIK